MATTYPRPDNLSEQVKFLAEFSWIYNFQLTRFFVDRVWEKIPIQWAPCLRDMAVDDLKYLPTGKVQEDWPEGFQHFVRSAMKFVRDREFGRDRNPVEIDKFVQRGMTPKKKHEVSNMAALVDVVAKKSGSDVIIDVGSGLGYLGQVLNQTFGYEIIGLESKNCHTSGADKRIDKQECDRKIQNITFELQNDDDTLRAFESVIFGCLKDNRISNSKKAIRNSDNHCKCSSRTKYSVAQKCSTTLPSNLCNTHVTSDECNMCYATLEECNTVSTECNKTASDCCMSSECKPNFSEDEKEACVCSTGRNKAPSECNTSSECNETSDQCFTSGGRISITSEYDKEGSDGSKSSECKTTFDQSCTSSGGITVSCEYDKADNISDTCGECNTSGQCNRTSCECNITSREYSRTSCECNTVNECNKTPSECSISCMECNKTPDEHFIKGEFITTLSDSSKTSCESYNNSCECNDKSCVCNNKSCECNKKSCECSNSSCECNKSVEHGLYISSASKISSILDTDSGCIDKPSVLMIGLHCCGDLTPTMMNYFSKLDFVKGLCCVSCCYHRMKFHDDNKKFDNFPLSQTLRTVMKQEKCWTPDIYSMRLAAQETRARWTNQNEHNHQTHMKHVAYRGILEYHLNQEKVECGKLFRRIVKKSDFDTFQSYIDAACSRVDLESSTENVDIEDVKRKLWCLHEEFQDKFIYIEPLTALQVMIQPIIEDLIYTDRLLWLQESGHKGEIIPVFDEFISPRNLALLALK